MEEGNFLRHHFGNSVFFHGNFEPKPNLFVVLLMTKVELWKFHGEPKFINVRLVELWPHLF